MRLALLPVFLVLAFRSDQGTDAAPLVNKDHWHAAIGVNVLYIVDESGKLLEDLRLGSLVLADESSPFLMTGSFLSANAAVAARDAVMPGRTSSSASPNSPCRMKMSPRIAKPSAVGAPRKADRFTTASPT